MEDCFAQCCLLPHACDLVRQRFVGGQERELPLLLLLLAHDHFPDHRMRELATGILHAIDPLRSITSVTSVKSALMVLLLKKGFASKVSR